jgi:hypothetical protein
VRSQDGEASGLDPEVLHSVAGASLAELRGQTRAGITCETLIERKGGSTDVDGPVLEADGLQVHSEFY